MCITVRRISVYHFNTSLSMQTITNGFYLGILGTLYNNYKLLGQKYYIKPTAYFTLYIFQTFTSKATIIILRYVVP